MELWAWGLTVAVFAFSFGTCALIAANIYGARRIKRLESLVVWQDERLYDLSKSVDEPSQKRYELRRAARKITVSEN